MLILALAPYLYVIPAAVMALGAWAYVFFFGEDLWLYALMSLAVLVVYPLWRWWWGSLPTEFVSMESLAALVACLGLAAVGGSAAAITDGTW